MRVRSVTTAAHLKSGEVELCYHQRAAQLSPGPLTSQHGVLVLGCADQPADPINHLALRVQLFLLRLLAEKNHWNESNIELIQKHTFFKSALFETRTSIPY